VILVIHQRLVFRLFVCHKFLNRREDPVNNQIAEFFNRLNRFGLFVREHFAPAKFFRFDNFPIIKSSHGSIRREKLVNVHRGHLGFRKLHHLGDGRLVEADINFAAHGQHVEGKRHCKSLCNAMDFIVTRSIHKLGRCFHKLIMESIPQVKLEFLYKAFHAVVSHRWGVFIKGLFQIKSKVSIGFNKLVSLLVLEVFIYFYFLICFGFFFVFFNVSPINMYVAVSILHCYLYFFIHHFQHFLDAFVSEKFFKSFVAMRFHRDGDVAKNSTLGYFLTEISFKPVSNHGTFFCLGLSFEVDLSTARFYNFCAIDARL